MCLSTCSILALCDRLGACPLSALGCLFISSLVCPPFLAQHSFFFLYFSLLYYLSFSFSFSTLFSSSPSRFNPCALSFIPSVDCTTLLQSFVVALHSALLLPSHFLAPSIIHPQLDDRSLSEFLGYCIHTALS